MPPHRIQRPHGDYVLSSDPDRVDVDVVHRYLADQSYWARGRSRELVARSIAHSALVVSAFGPDGVQVGFARLVTDLSTFAWLCDVFVLDEHRGHGLGVALVEALVDHPDVEHVKRQLLATEDAHELYRRFGFGPLDPEHAHRWMSRSGPNP